MNRAWLVACLLSVWPMVAAAQAPMFVWVDKKGEMHVTDRLQDVPEPWFSMYDQRLKELEKQGRLPQASLPSDTSPPPVVVQPMPTPPGATVAQIAAQRQQWKAVMTRWRTELAAATAELQKVERDYEETGMNPILRETPAVKEKLTDIAEVRRQARARVEAARSMLQDVLPKKARDEHIPPLWLQ